MDNNKPFYSLTVGEYIELNRQLLADYVLAALPKKEPTTKESDICFINEASNITGLSVSTLYTKHCKGELPGVYKAGGKLRFSREELTNWILSNKSKTIAELENQTNHYLAKKRK